MSDDPTKFIIGDTAISAAEEHPGGKRGFFGRKRRQRRQITHCENCGTALTGPYCGQCGQPAIDYRRSFRHVIIDLLDSFLNWDSKFIATIALLIARPWHLTNEFLAGRRVKYLHPARLYLLASILFFFAVTYWVKSFKVDPVVLSQQARAEIVDDLKREEIPADIRTGIEDALKMKSLPPEERTKLEEDLKREDLPAEERTRTETALKEAALPPEVLSQIKQALKRKDLSPAAREQLKEAFEKASVAKGPSFFQVGPDHDDSKDSPFEKWMTTRAKEKFGEHGTNIQLFLITLISNLPYMVLACIPLFAFVLKVLYIRKRIFYIDHLVYALHIHTFLYLAVMLIVAITLGLNHVMPGTLAGWIIGLLWTVFAVQIFLSIRRVYKQGWFFSTFKFFAGGFVYLIVLLFALAATFFITLALP